METISSSEIEYASTAATSRVITSPLKIMNGPVQEPMQVVERSAISTAAAAAVVVYEDKQPKTLSKASKKHKKKRKARSKSMQMSSTNVLLAQELQRKSRSTSLGGKKHVIWGDVSAREFARFPGGGSAVPYDGTWALGLGKKIADVELGSVQEVELLREQALQERAKKLSKSKRRDVRTQEEGAFQTPMLSSVEIKKLRRKYSTGSTASLESFEELQVADAAMTAPDFGCVSIEQLEEFVKIRGSRDGACGCSCGDLVKKVAKMSVKKLRAFLQERNILPPGPGKTELMAAAKKVAREEKNCQSADSDCECARNGVPCHSDVCEGCAGDCNNPFQRYEYKSDEVKQYRKEQLAKWQQLQVELTQSSEAAAPVCVS
ncbi:unnamed protein product [Peronospora belbahrii]|uniref:SAP domain-containing protein n=1 Tax=Peronospora belbahrii TaxID=622444 RepID=A0AAU9L2U5_9STRA|nr:unnamed protein product [Peronospora belbahrii]